MPKSLASAKQRHRQLRSDFSNRILALGIITALVLSSITAISILESRPHPLRLVAYTPTESLENPRLPLIFQDLQLIRQIGFDGVKLWDANELYERGWLSSILDEAGRLGLKVNVVYQFPDLRDAFPPNRLATVTIHDRIIELSAVTRLSNSVVWNSLFAPFDWNMSVGVRQSIVRSENYRFMLEQALAEIKIGDPVHQVRISYDFDPWIGAPFLQDADGYGVMPYSVFVDRIDLAATLAFVSYFLPQGKPVYVDEWGLQTTNFVSHGRASGQEAKATLLLDYARMAEFVRIDWTYFMLTDRIHRISFENGVDWGIVNMDRSLRESALFMQQFLHSNN